MTHISVLFIYITKFFVQANQHTTNRVRIAIVISWWRKRKQFHRSEWFRFLFWRYRLSLMRNSLFYTYPPKSVRCDHKRSVVESNRYLLAVDDSHNYRDITDTSVGSRH